METELRVRKILGKTYLNENRLADALDVFSKILVDYPDDVETLHVLGNFYLASGDGKTAKKIYQHALQLDPENRIIQRQVSLADEMGDVGLDEPIPTDIPAVSRLLQRLTGKSQALDESDIMRAATLLAQIVDSNSPAQVVADHLDEIDELMPALIELNIRQAYSDGRPDLAESLRTLQLNIDFQLISRKDDPAQRNPPSHTESSSFQGKILFLMPEAGQKSKRMTLLKSALEALGCAVTEKRDFVSKRDGKPDVAITSNPHLNLALVDSLSSLSAAGVPIIMDLDTDFEKQPITHPDYNTKGLGNPERSAAYARAFALADLVTVPSQVQFEALSHLTNKVCVIPDGWSDQNKLWQKSSPVRSTINIGWVGTNSQIEDLMFIRRFIVRIIREFPNTRVVIIDDPQAYRLFENLPENRRMYLPTVSPEEFPYQLSQLDVLLVPLRNTPFNLSSPDTILMEAGAKGLPWVASSIPAFRCWQRGGVISESLDEWHLNIRHLVMDKELRRRLGEEGKFAAKAREMNQIGTVWSEVINQLANITPADLSMVSKSISA